jgi:hypothetical protein
MKRRNSSAFPHAKMFSPMFNLGFSVHTGAALQQFDHAGSKKSNYMFADYNPPVFARAYTARWKEYRFSSGVEQACPYAWASRPGGGLRR